MRSGDADPTAGAISAAVRKWKQGDGENGYYYTGSAWQSGAATVTSTKKDLHAHEVTIDETRMGSLAGFEISARAADAGAIGPTTWLHIADDFSSKSNDTINAKTTNLPSDPASETNINANETKIDSVQSDVTAILADTDAIDTRLPSDPADQSLLDAEHATTQGLISGLNDVSATDVADAVWDEDIADHLGIGSTGEALDRDFWETRPGG